MKRNMLLSKVLTVKGKKMLIYPDRASDNWKPEPHKNRDVLLKENNLKLKRLRNWMAIKYFQNSSNPFFRKLYSDLLKSNIVDNNF